MDLAMVSDNAMADETTPVNGTTRTPVRVGTAMTVVVIEATAVKAASEAKAAFEQRFAVMVVVTVVALASVRHVAAAVGAKGGRTKVVGPRKALVEIRTGESIRVRVQIKPHALMYLAGSIRVLDAPIRAAGSTRTVVANKAVAPIRVAGSIRTVAASKAVAPITVADSSKRVAATQPDASIKVAGSSKVVAASAAVASIAVAAASRRPAPIRAATSIRAHGVIRLPGLTKASFGTTLATAPQREPLDRTPMETVRVVIARIAVAAANAVVDEDADAADAAVAAEVKAAIAKVARRADRPWKAARKAVDQRIPSLPKPRRCHRVTVAIITTRVARTRVRTNSRVLLRRVASTASLAMKPRTSVSLGSRSRLVSRSSPSRPNRWCVSRSRSVRRSQHASHSRTPGHPKPTIGRPSLNSGHRLLRRNM